MREDTPLVRIDRHSGGHVKDLDVNSLSQLPRSEQARLFEELNYMSLKEIRGFCSEERDRDRPRRRTRTQQTVPSVQRRCRFEKAMPEPDFKYRSNKTARFSSANQTSMTTRHGFADAVCRQRPALCASSRARVSAVSPV